MGLAAERASSGSRGADADAERVRVTHVVHSHGHVVVLVVRADGLEAPAIAVSLRNLPLDDCHYLLCEINTLVVIILGTSVHARVSVLLRLVVMMVLLRGRRRRQLLVATVVVHFAGPV